MRINGYMKGLVFLCFIVLNVNVGAITQLKLKKINPDYPLSKISDVRWNILKKVTSYLNNMYLEYSNHLSEIKTSESRLSFENSFLLFKTNAITVLEKRIAKSDINIQGINGFINWWNQNGLYEQSLWLSRCKSMGKKKVLLRRGGSISSASSYYECFLGTKLFE